MPHTFDICIDESGDDGFTFEKPDCSRWFIISAAVVVRRHILLLDEILRDLKAQFHWKPKKPLHFRDLKPDIRKTVTIARLATDGMRIFRGITIAVHKPSLSDPETFQDKHRLYFYFTRFLLERASWICRDAAVTQKRDFGDGRARVVFSARNDLSYDEMLSYLQTLQTKETSIAWPSIDTSKIVTLTNGKHSGLQVADSIASAFYCADHHRPDLCCHEWVRALKPVMYSYKGRCRGYGVKIFPPEAEKQIAQGALAPWATLHYPS